MRESPAKGSRNHNTKIYMTEQSGKRVQYQIINESESGIVISENSNIRRNSQDKFVITGSSS